MTDTNQSGRLSRRGAVTLFAGGPALAGMLGGTAAASLLFAGGVQACGSSAAFPSTPADLAAEHFEPLVGTQFTVGAHPVTLSEVRRGPAAPARFRQPFAITFSAPPAFSIASESVRVTHPAIGGHDLFVTEVMRGTSRALEICFS
ncbi:MAG TPA: hypothetical protein VKX28_15545 [Xanthobacteraceae bacterium]|nr:hypothetical protein [Xanthobacteraceae bacterium]